MLGNEELQNSYSCRLLCHVVWGWALYVTGSWCSYGSVVRFCEYGSEPSTSEKYEEFLE